MTDFVHRIGLKDLLWLIDSIFLSAIRQLYFSTTLVEIENRTTNVPKPFLIILRGLDNAGDHC